MYSLAVVTRFIAIFLICSLFTQAYAKETLRVIGRGIEDRKTGEVIALVCVGEPIDGSDLPSCRTLRPLKYDPIKKTSDWISNEAAFEMQNERGVLTHEPSEAELKEYVRQINRNVLKYRYRENKERNAAVYGTIATVICLSFVAGVITMNEMKEAEDPEGEGLSTGPVLLGWAGVMALIGALSKIVKNPVFAKTGAISEAMIDQNGWNWSVKPRKISHRNFRWVDQYFRSY